MDMDHISVLYIYKAFGSIKSSSLDTDNNVFW
jgi:hypothetical protein